MRTRSRDVVVVLSLLGLAALFWRLSIIAPAVVFEYDPASFAIGRGVTLAALAVVAGVPLLALYRRRTRVGTLTAV